MKKEKPKKPKNPKYLTLKQMLTCKEDIIVNCKGDEPYYIIVKLKDGRKLLVKRVGKCDYKKCGNACCKYVVGFGQFAKGFYDYKKYGSSVINKKCKHLKKNGKCDIWGTKKFPNACKQFPHPTDAHYHITYKKCGFRFKILYEIKEVI